MRGPTALSALVIHTLDVLQQGQPSKVMGSLRSCLVLIVVVPCQGMIRALFRGISQDTFSWCKAGLPALQVHVGAYV